VAAAKAQGLTNEAGRVAFLVDGDEGGLRNRTKLINGQVDPDLILVLREAGPHGCLERTRQESVLVGDRLIQRATVVSVTAETGIEPNTGSMSRLT